MKTPNAKERHFPNRLGGTWPPRRVAEN